MKTKMTNRELETQLSRLERISDDKTVLPIKVSYRIIQNTLVMRKALEAYIISKDHIIEKYSDGKGSITEVDDPVMFKKACTEIAQIASEKVELDISTITLEEFETDRLPFDVISALGFMIIDTKQIGGI